MWQSAYGRRKNGSSSLCLVTLFKTVSDPQSCVLLRLGTPRVSCVPSEIKGKKSAIGKLLETHKRGTQSTLHSSDGSINFTLWKDGSSVLFADNDFDASSVANITGKIYNKKKKEFKGRRAYAANDAVRCYRCVHNSVDIHNQLAAYGNWDYRTRRKQTRVPICFPRICRLEILAYS